MQIRNSLVLHAKVATFLLAALLTAGGTVLFRYLENWSWTDAFYFTVVTMTTIGYGDLVPQAPGSRLAIALFVLVTIPVWAVSIALLAEAVHEWLHARDQQSVPDESAARRTRRR